MIGQKMLMFGKMNVNTPFFLFLLEWQYACNSKETLKAYIRQSHCLGVQMMTEYISQENMKLDTLNCWIGTVFPLVMTEEKAKQ